jgi:ribosome-associated translation inhibitor RaiA
MTLRISGKSISVGEALRGRVSERTEEVLRKYFDGNYSGHITLSKDGFGFRTDCACIWIPELRSRPIPMPA